MKKKKSCTTKPILTIAVYVILIGLLATGCIMNYKDPVTLEPSSSPEIHEVYLQIVKAI